MIMKNRVINYHRQITTLYNKSKYNDLNKLEQHMEETKPRKRYTSEVSLV